VRGGIEEFVSSRLLWALGSIFPGHRGIAA